MIIKNFGHNFEFKPKYFYEPKDESEVLDILNRHNSGTIRCIGSGHAWNKGIYSDDVFVDIKHLNKIVIENDCVNTQGGVKLENLIKFLTKRNLMIPAMGGILKQSVAGLASTATHGTGNHSFSHFVHSIRIAAYDTDGKAKIFEYTEGDTLKAARCAVGCMGVIVSMKIKTVPRYFMLESSHLVSSIDEVISAEAEWPFSQTVIVPYSWKFLIFRRKKIESRTFSQKIKAWLMRGMDFVVIENMPHVFLKIILLFKNSSMYVWYYRDFLSSLLGNSISVINEDYRALTLHVRHHYYYRHVEMEIFIPEKKMKEVFMSLKEIIEVFAGLTSPSADMEKHLQGMKGKYTLHYTPFIRKILPDDTLISMTAGGESYYSIGLFTYNKEKDREGYYLFTKTVAKILSEKYGVRIHWGKHFPLDFEDVNKLYPNLEQFKNICREVDPKGVFQNDFTKRIFGL